MSHVIWLRRSLPGDTDELRQQLHTLNNAGLLPVGGAEGALYKVPCPRCGRDTATWKSGGYLRPATVCASCRADWLVDQAPQVAEWNARIRARDHG
jgi:hypothetical protein